MQLAPHLLALCEAAHANTATVREAAMLSNLQFDENLSDGRAEAYGVHVGVVRDAAMWMEGHRAYVTNQVNVLVNEPTACAETFRESNKQAHLAREPDETWLIRLESLQSLQNSAAFKEGWDRSSVEAFWQRYRNSPKDLESRPDAALIDPFLKVWNEYVRTQSRPMFSTFLDQFGSLKDLIKSDWPHILRDRLGLAHYQPAGAPIPVALMVFKVSEVRQAMQLDDRGGTCALAKPTALDADLSPFFFPAPQSAAAGCTLDLSPAVPPKTLLKEVLAYRVDYLARHLKAFGLISKPHAFGNPSKPAPAELRTARNAHLSLLRAESGRSDFGRMLPEAAP